MTEDPPTLPASPAPSEGALAQCLAVDPAHLAEVIASARDAIVNTDARQRIVLFNAAAARMFGRPASAVMGRPVTEILEEGLLNGDPVQEIVLAGPAAKLRQTQRLSVLTGRRGDGTRFPVEAAISQIAVGQGAILTAVVRDITDRVQAVEILRRSEQALADVFATSPIGLMCVTPEGRVERVNEAQLALLGRPMDEVMGRRLADLHTYPDAIVDLLSLLARGAVVHDFHVHTGTGAELKHLLVDASGVWEQGALVRSRWFVRDITSRMQLETEILTIAECERQRIGHDLHDDLCQHLVAIECMVDALAASLPRKERELADAADRISFQLRAAIDRTRELARGLAPSLPEQPEGLVTALRELAEHTTRIFQRDCRFECPKPVRSPDHATTIHLFRIAQEAVRNAVKHAQARQITIRLGTSGSDLVLGITDDGNGAAPDPGKTPGMGLRVMQYRAGAIGGSLVIQRKPNQGTSVICTVRSAGEPEKERA